MLERLAGNTALKSELGAALGAGRLPHAILLVGEPGCGAGFAARCLAADYLYPQGGPHAEAVLKKEDTECLVLQGEGASGQIAVKRVREMREAIQRSALSTDAAGRVLFIYGAQNLNGSSANAMLKIIEEPPEGVLFVLTATSAATVLPTIRSRCAAYTIAPVPTDECAALLTREGLPARLARSARTADSLEDFYARAKTKRYPHARLRRLALAAFLGLRAAERPPAAPYVRVLGLSGRGRELLRRMKETCALPVVVKPAQARALDGDARALFEAEARRTDLFGLCFPTARPCGLEWTRSPVVKERQG